MVQTETIEQLKQQMENGPIHLIDVREAEEYEAGHVPSARNIPLSELEQQLHVFDKEETYHIICRSGRRSLQAIEILEEAGIHGINVDGGTLAWNLPLEQ